MIITLKGADFSKNNIGPLSSWLISREIGYGARYSGPVYVSKGGAFSATVVLAEGYTLDSAGVTVIMGGTAVTSGVTVNGNTITINIASVTGNVVIKVPTKNTSTGEEEEPETSTNYTFTINPTPTSATVTLTASGYSTVSGTGSKSITVANGTKVNWTVSASGYTTRTGSWTISGGNKTENIVLTTSGGETIEFTSITGTFITAEGGINTNANWNATDYITVYPNGKYTYYGNTAVGGGTTPAVYAYDANKTPIQALCTGIDGTNGYLFTTTADTAYIKLCSHKDTALKLEYTPNALEVAYVTNGYVSKTGEIATVSGWTRTEYIDVSDHRNINYLGTVPEGGLSTVAAIYGYDSAKAPVEMVLAPSTNEHVNGYVVTLTNDNIKYIVSCAFTRNGEAFSITSAE